jgi:hypothetical protein
MGGNLSVLENTFKYFIQSQTEQNNILMNIRRTMIILLISCLTKL